MSIKRTRNTNPPAKCTVDGCDNKHVAKGFCGKHWKRWKKYGDPLAGGTTPGALQIEVDRLSKLPVTDECIKWPYGCDKGGHGVCYPDGKTPVFVSRVLMEMRAPRPSDKHMALHKCHNGHEGCVNPHHLYWGTQADNTHDMVAAGRHPTQKITAAIAQQIWDAKGTGTAKQVASRFPGATVHIVLHVWKGAWAKHITHS